ncbi:FAD-dependent oxidoreductase [Streptomyces sp. NPDC046727]|uniref:FAD-dependent oxidoreductase n=1 Tax=Streptomyces sp. NPDC046727 TaxID=3155373 RepID=UPI0033D8ED2A
MTQAVDHDFDVVVVGGGPGGSSASAFVAMQGHRVLLLEKEQFPRHQIGESLLPSTVHGICRLLGVSEELSRAGFMVKRGGTFRWGSNAEPWTFDFALSPKFAGHTSFAYQVERMKFDKLLLDNARRKGVDVRERSTVVDIVEDGGRVRGVVYDDEHGVRHEVSAHFVVDASGNQSRLQGRIGGRRQYSEFFQNIALYGYYEGGMRQPAPNSGNITCVASSSGWLWYIPLSDKLTSVGAVVRRDQAHRVQGDRVEALTALISECPLVSDYLSEAHRVQSGPYGQVRIRKDYSYLHDSFWRPGMVLIGDAACFIDPLFSSGVHLATYSALLAARSINTALRGEIAEQECFTEYEARYRKEYHLFHDFLTAFYDVNQDEQRYFEEAARVTRDAASSQAEAFVGLVGGGASSESALVSETYRAQRRAALRDHLPRMHWEGQRLQVQAAFGEVAGDIPLREGGLVETEDGMHWTRGTQQPARVSQT